MNSPRPAPGVVALVGSRAKRPKSSSRCSSGTPGPPSATSTVTVSFAAAGGEPAPARRRGENLSALDTRLLRICQVRCGSPSAVTSSSPSTSTGRPGSRHLGVGHDLIDQRADVDHLGADLQLTGVEPDRVEQVVDEAAEASRRLARPLDQLPELVVGHGVPLVSCDLEERLHDPDRARRSWATTAMRSVFRRSSSRRRLAASRSRSRMPRSASSLRLRSVRSRVTLAKPRWLPSGPCSDGDDDVGPEPGAVLPDPPALVPPAPGLERRGQPRLGHARPPVFVGVEGREVPADDLVGPVALQLLRAEVPGRDGAVGPQHEDGVVGDAADQEGEPLLALAQGVLASLPLGEVAGDLPEADQMAVGVPDRGDHDVGPEAGPVLADPPSLVLERAVGGGDGQLPIRLARLEVVLRVEDREVPADDLIAAGSPSAARRPRSTSGCGRRRRARRWRSR